MAFKLDTEETASAIIARRLASAESLSSQKDEIIRSMNFQLRELAKIDNGNVDSLLTEEEEESKDNEKSKEGGLASQKSESFRKLELAHSDYVKMMEKKHKEELDALGCKLARLEAHYARITGDLKAAGLTEEQIDNTPTASARAQH